MMRIRTIALAGISMLALLSLLEVQARPREGQGASAEHFPAPVGLRPQVDFWKDVFATYSKYQVVIHDTKYIDKIYAVLDFRPLLAEGKSESAVQRIKSERTKAEQERIRAILLKLDRAGASTEGLSLEERRIRDLYQDVRGADKFRDAAAEDRLRTQTGLLERFAQGLRTSGRYLGEMEAIFRREGLPVELTRLPLIESSFDLKAYSKVGAAGIWQFMPATGKHYLRIDSHFDERRDPLISTRAAARLLKDNYKMLGTWPLAITAYNHGPFGVYKATQALDTRDIVTIVREYDGQRFGFASKNFYAEFLAALEIERDRRKHFGALKDDKPLRYDTVRLEHFVPLKALARCADADVDTLLALNPAFEAPIREGRAHVPRGYTVRIPPGRAAQFQQRYAALGVREKATSQKPVYVVHKVRRGQTLAKIARQYGTTVKTLARINGVKNGKRLQAGQVLRVPAET